MSSLVSRKLVAGIVAILVVGLNARMGLGLTDQEIQAIQTIALAVIGAQGSADLATSLIPFFSKIQAPTKAEG